MTDDLTNGEPWADVRETHSGVVVLLGDMAYKLKKPIKLPFLDFTTPAKRRSVCEREVALNRRLAPDVYLAVASLEQPGSAGEPLVMMRRMRAAYRLSRLAETGGGVEEIRTLARVLAEFHSRADRSRAISDEGRRDKVRSRWRDNLEEASVLPGGPIPSDLLDRVRTRTERYLAGRERLFDERIAQGKVIDGHGDLLADDIFCLPDGPRVLDCLEFDDRLRHLDQVDDIACLAMDLLRLGRADLAARLVKKYREFSGDRAPQSLVHHYIAYRAFMRAKVTAVRLQSSPAASGSFESPIALTRLALSHLDTAAVRLVLVGGPPGSGKSTVAELLAERLGYVTVASDIVRKELAGLAARTDATAPFEEGIYTAAWTDRTYKEMLHRAEMLLSRGQSVILDATWRDAELRAAAHRLADGCEADLVELRCDVSADVAADRMKARDGASDADGIIAEAMRAVPTVWSESLPIDTGQDLRDSVEAAVAAVLSERPFETPAS